MVVLVLGTGMGGSLVKAMLKVQYTEKSCVWLVHTYTFKQASVQRYNSTYFWFLFEF